MKTIYLVRHAKAEHPKDGQTDKERRLRKKGIEEAKNLGRFLNNRSEKIDLIVSSTAQRALETAEYVADELDYTQAIQREEMLYSSNPKHYFDVLYTIPNEIERVMLVAHNDTITLFANFFLQTPLFPIATGNLVAFYFSVSDWQCLSPTSIPVNFLIYSKNE